MSTPQPRHGFTGYLLSICLCDRFGAAYTVSSTEPDRVRPLDALAIADHGNAKQVVGLHLEPDGTWTCCNDCPTFARIVRLPPPAPPELTTIIAAQPATAPLPTPWLRRLFAGKLRPTNG